MSPLIARLAAIQKAQHLTDAQVADRLGVTRPMWSMLRNGKLEPGGRTIAGIVKSFPELTTDVLLFLQAKGGAHNKNEMGLEQAI